MEYFLTNYSWGEGEWLKEPGLFEKELFEYKGYKCALMRSHPGTWNGYVAVPKRSKWAIIQENDSTILSSIEVHGGITWSKPYLPWEEKESEDLFWLGFDCFHCGDYGPRWEAVTKNVPREYEFKKVYRTMEYARNEIKKMVDQLEKDK